MWCICVQMIVVWSSLLPLPFLWFASRSVAVDKCRFCLFFVCAILLCHAFWLWFSWYVYMVYVCAVFFIFAAAVVASLLFSSLFFNVLFRLCIPMLFMYTRAPVCMCAFMCSWLWVSVFVWYVYVREGMQSITDYICCDIVACAWVYVLGAALAFRCFFCSSFWKCDLNRLFEFPIPPQNPCRYLLSDRLVGRSVDLLFQLDRI